MKSNDPLPEDDVDRPLTLPSSNDIADTFQVKVRAYREVIGYYPSFDDADPVAKRPARVTNRRKVGVGHSSKVEVDDFHKLDSNAVDRPPKTLWQPASKSDDEE